MKHSRPIISHSPIRTEKTFLLSLLKDLLLTPVVIVLALFGKRRFSDILRPFANLFTFLFEPKFTISMIITNSVLFFWSLTWSEQFIQSLLLYPSEIAQGNLLPLVTSGFLHANLSHLAGNLLALFVFGRVVEKWLGPFKCALVYLGAMVIAGIFTSLTHLYLIGDNTGGLGASGAIMGLVSTAILLDPFFFTYQLIIPIPIMVLGWLTIYADISGILNPVEDGIGHFAHLGGFLSITLLMYLFDKNERHKLRKGLLINVISLALIAGLYFIFLYKGLF